jgi:hypothetical protein
MHGHPQVLNVQDADEEYGDHEMHALYVTCLSNASRRVTHPRLQSMHSFLQGVRGRSDTNPAAQVPGLQSAVCSD